ncbi:MAG: hypothetical protein J1E97_03980 [Muribaculaceae bacterium]|nr:hypothetical protein [Muribaculaceae bacterium]
MKKNQKILLFGAVGVFLALAALIVVLIVKNAEHTRLARELEERADSLRNENNRLELESLTGEFDRLNAEFDQIEDRELLLQNDSLVQQYNEAREKLTSLMQELEKEKKSNRANLQKIKELEAEIATLRGIAKHYLEEIRRINGEKEALQQELTETKGRNETLERENASYSQSNAELTKTVQLAKKLNITGLSLSIYNKKNKEEKSIKKAEKLGVSFVVTPNNTAAPGMKDFYVRILSPEGSLLGAGPSFSYDGATLTSTASRSMEYDNQELQVSVYWTVNATLTAGTYTVEVFADGYRLGTGKFTLKK